MVSGALHLLLSSPQCIVLLIPKARVLMASRRLSQFHASHEAIQHLAEDIAVRECVCFLCHCNKLPQTLWLKTARIYHLSSEGQKSNMGLSGRKSTYWQGCLPSKGSRGESISSPFPASGDVLQPLDHGLSLHHQSQ